MINTRLWSTSNINYRINMGVGVMSWISLARFTTKTTQYRIPWGQTMNTYGTSWHGSKTINKQNTSGQDYYSEVQYICRCRFYSTFHNLRIQWFAFWCEQYHMTCTAIRVQTSPNIETTLYLQQTNIIELYSLINSQLFELKPIFRMGKPCLTIIGLYYWKNTVH